MGNLLHRIIFIFFQFFVTENLQNYFINILLKLKGYNNFKNFNDSGEEYFLNNVLAKHDPKVCIDVGSHIGKYTSMLLSSTNSKVISFEPLKKSFSSLLELQKIWGVRLVLVNKGLGAQNLTSKIYFNQRTLSHASLLPEANELEYIDNNESQDIELITLDSFMEENDEVTSLDYIKIDTEGFEYDVLMGSKKTISKFNPKFIHIEYNWHQLLKSQSLYSFALILKNYEPYQLLSNKLIKRDPLDPLSNIYSYSNFVFIRKDLSLEL